MDYTTLFATRTSGVAIRLTEPSPDHATMMKWIQNGMSAPDYSGLKPWRFCLMHGQDIANFALHAKRIKKEESPDISDEELEKIYQKPFRAPVIIACWSCTQPDDNVTADEQLIATSMAVEHILLSAHAEGWGAVLLSGWFAKNHKMQQLFGLKADDKMLGYIYIGTHKVPPKTRKRPDASAFMVKPSFMI